LTVLRRGLRAVILLAVAWAAIVIVSGGIQFKFGSLRLSSREPDNPLLVAVGAVVALVVAARLDGPGGVSGEWAWWRASARSTITWTQSHAHETVPVIIAVVVAGARIYRWTGAPPMWLDEESPALLVRERSFGGLGGPVWMGSSAPRSFCSAARSSRFGSFRSCSGLPRLPLPSGSAGGG